MFQDKNGDSVLEWAIKNKKLNIIHYFLKNHASLFTIRNKDRFLPIHEVAFNGFYKAVPLIFNQYRDHMNIQLKNGKTPLHLAVREGNFKTFVELLKLGACQVLADEKGFLPIHLAAMNDRIEMVQVLLDENPDLINYRVPSSLKTPLHFAAEKGHLRIVEELLHSSALTRFADVNGCLPLHLAASVGHEDIVKLIISKDPSSINFRETIGWKTAMHFACAKGHLNTVATLLRHGAFLKIMDLSKLTPLHLAVMNGHTDVVKIILESTLDQSEELIHYPTLNGWTSLHLAIFNGYADLVKELLIRGADPEMETTKEGFRPLMLLELSQFANDAEIRNDIETAIREKRETASRNNLFPQILPFKKPRF